MKRPDRRNQRYGCYGTHNFNYYFYSLDLESYINYLEDNAKQSQCKCEYQRTIEAIKEQLDKVK